MNDNRFSWRASVPKIFENENLFKEIENANSNAPGKSTGFEQMFVGWDEIYLQNERLKRSLYNHLMKNKTKYKKTSLE